MFEPDTVSKDEKPKFILSKKEKWIAILVLMVLILLVGISLVFRKNIDVLNIVNHYSLVGVLVISVVACSPTGVFVPIPYLLVILTLPGVLAGKWGVVAPVWVGITAAFGATIGQFLSFMIGYGSRNISESLFARISAKAYNKADTWIKKYGSATVFVVSAVPNPVHLPVTVTLGAARFSPSRWFFLSLSGNLVKCLFIAFAGYFSMGFVLRLLGS